MLVRALVSIKTDQLLQVHSLLISLLVNPNAVKLMCAYFKGTCYIRIRQRYEEHPGFPEFDRFFSLDSFLMKSKTVSLHTAHKSLDALHTFIEHLLKWKHVK